MQRTEMKPYDASCRMSKPGLSCMLEALVEVGGQMLDSHHDKHEPRYANRSLEWVQFRIKIPAGTEGKFEEISRVKLQEIPQVGDWI